MSDNRWQHNLRSPRHETSAAEGRAVRVERRPGNDPLVTSARLVDLSRTGFKLRASLPLEIGEPVLMQLHDDQTGTELTLSGEVRWCRSDDNNTWLLGCQSDWRTDWETLGELFISGVLNSERIKNTRST